MDSFFGIGIFELVMIAIIALVVLGPERLPGAMREVAKYMRQLRNISSEFQSQFSEELQMLDEINPKRILSDAMTPPAKPQTQPPPKPAAQTAKPVTRPAQPPAAKKAEADNSMLPPAASSQPAAAQNGAASPPAASDQVTVPTTPGAGVPANDGAGSAGVPAAETEQ